MTDQRITELEAEVERLTVERDEAFSVGFEQVRRRCEQAEAEVARLRRVVQRVEALAREWMEEHRFTGHNAKHPEFCSCIGDRILLAAEGLPVPTDTPARKACGCRVNAAGDIRCHNCGQYVNVQCWNCGTPRGEGDCPTPAVPTAPQSMRWVALAVDGSLNNASEIVAWVNANGGEARYEPDKLPCEPKNKRPYIVITGPNGPVIVKPGDTVQMTGERFHGFVRDVMPGVPDVVSSQWLRAFRVETTPPVPTDEDITTEGDRS